MTKRKIETKRKTVIERVAADVDKLYGPLDVTIAYLQQMQKSLPAGAALEEHWTGYEDMQMCISWARDETDEELKLRLAQEEHDRKLAEEIAKLKREKDKRKRQWEKLRREFGY